MSPDVPFFLFLCLPLYFLFRFSLHICAHYHDGISFTRDRTKLSRIGKEILCVSEAISSGYFVLGGSDSDVLRIVQGFLVLTWFLSAYLVYFDYLRALQTGWSGQRLYWILTFGVNIGYLGLELDKESTLEIASALVISEQLIVSLVLACFALCRPNDYILSKENQQILENLLLTQDSPKKYQSSMTDSQFSVSLSAYKVKRLDSFVLIDYRFVILASGHPHQVRLSTSKLEHFDQMMREKFNQEEYPYLDLPVFPKIEKKGLDIDEQAKKMEMYLTAYCKREYRCQELYDFLGISEGVRPYLETPLPKFIDMYESISLSSRNSSEVNLFPHCLDDAQAIFFTSRIEGWSKVETPLPHIVYKLQWTLIGSDTSGIVLRRYSDFFSLHLALKSAIGTSKMPEFPSKNYFQSLIGELDHTALDLRRKALESYISCVLNDPAYCCPILLEFIECMTPLEEIWRKVEAWKEIRMAGAVTRMSEFDSEGAYYTCYNLPLEQDDSQWSVTRRFREFSQMHEALSSRIESQALMSYLQFQYKDDFDAVSPSLFLPQLPKKTLLQISSLKELEERRTGLEQYFGALLKVPHVWTAYAFRVFVRGRRTELD